MSTLHSFEQKLYEILGIQFFRKLVFGLEKFIHFCDKKRNINYHISECSLLALEDFIKYLFYNGAIHVRNLLCFGVYGVLHYLLKWETHWYDICLCILALKDLYCVILQRYNYIRIRQRQVVYEQKRRERICRKAELLRPTFLEKYNEKYLDKDRQILKEMKKKIQSGECFIVGTEEIAMLDRFSKIIGYNGKEESYGKTSKLGK